ncbi:MAG TPA: hypothetical protein VFP58_15390 [Candidatus Eisenbacteria bacterium]|nr:hypothetical protein [Candidatus Eisenbacteria bacterium]
MFAWIYQLPLWLLAFLICSLFLGLTWLGLSLMRPFVHRWTDTEEGWNHVMGHVIASHGVLYGILLALLALAALENRARLLDTVGHEASSLGTLYRDATGYPEPLRSSMMSSLRDYCTYVIEVAWQEQRRGRIPQGGVERLNRFQTALMDFEPQTKGQEILHAQTLHEYNRFIEARRQRIYSAEHRLPAAMWWVVAAGAILGIVLTLLLHVRRPAAHFLLAGSLSLMTGLIIFLLAALDQPLRGGIQVTPEAFEIIRHNLMTPADPGDRH